MEFTYWASSILRQSRTLLGLPWMRPGARFSHVFLWDLRSDGPRMSCGIPRTGKLRKPTEYSVSGFPSMTLLTFCSKKLESLSRLAFFFLFVKQRPSGLEWSSASYPKLVPSNKTKMYVVFMVPLLHNQNSEYAIKLCWRFR